MKKTDTGKSAVKKPSFWSTLLHRVLYPASLIYTALTMLFYLCGPMFDLSDRHMVLTRTSGFLLLVFSLAFSVANNLLTMKKPSLHISLRIFLHYAITTLSFYVLFLSISGYDAGRSSTIILMLVFTVVYFLICGTILAVRSSMKKSAIESSDYRSIYN